VKTRASLGILQMLVTFLIILIAVGLPNNFWGVIVYVILMSLSSIVAYNIATHRGVAYLDGGGAGPFLIHCVGLMFAFCIIFLGGVILGGNLTGCTLTGVAVMSASTYLLCRELEPTEECLAQRKSVSEFQEKSRLEKERAVLSLIQSYPELDPKNFGIRECFTPTALFAVWNSIYTTVESIIKDMGPAHYKRMEIKGNYELLVIHSSGVNVIDSQTVVDEVRHSISLGTDIYKGGIIPEIEKRCSSDDCKKILDWLRRAIHLKKELGLFQPRGLIDRFSPWRVESSALVK
jgi:hypothetical protein